MISSIFQAAGIPNRETRWANPPEETYAIYFDDVTADGSDYRPLKLRHDCMVELYEDKPDPESEYALETAITNAGLEWVKQARYWLKDIKKYQVVYEFTYYEK